MAERSSYNQKFERFTQIEEISKDHHLNHRFENYEFDFTVRNYLSDPDINRSKSDVPKSLKMLGILLLNELTNHIKDHHFKARDQYKICYQTAASKWVLLQPVDPTFRPKYRTNKISYLYQKVENSKLHHRIRQAQR